MLELFRFFSLVLFLLAGSQCCCGYRVLPRQFANTTAITTQRKTFFSTTPSARPVLTTTASTSYVHTSTHSNLTSTKSPPVPSITLPPCCVIQVPTVVGLNYWYTKPVTVTVAVEISIFHQYNNTKVFASTTTSLIPNATAQYGAYPEWADTFRLSGVPSTLVPQTDGMYGFTIFTTFSSYSWPAQSLTLQSPTPFYTFQQGIWAWAGYQQVSTYFGQTTTVCNQLTQDPLWPSITYTNTMYLDPNDMPEDPSSSLGYVKVGGHPAFVYVGNLSTWVGNYGDERDGEGVANVPIDLDMPHLLAQLQGNNTQVPMLADCSWPGWGYGAPTVLIPATEVTAPTSITSTIAGNYVPSTPATTTQSQTQGEASRSTGTLFTVGNFPSPLDPTVLRVPSDATTRSVEATSPAQSPSEAASQPFVTSLSTQNPPEALSSEPVNLPSAASSAGPASTLQNKIDSAQSSSTADIGSLIAGVFGAPAQPAATPSTTLPASASPEAVSQVSQQDQATDDTLFTAANTLGVKPTTAINGATNNAQQGPAQTQQSDSTVKADDSDGGVSATSNTPVAGAAPATASQEAQQPQTTNVVVSGSVQAALSVPISSAGATETSGQPSLQTQTIPQPAATANNIPAQSPVTQQPGSNLAIIGGTTVSFLAASPTSEGSQDATPQSGHTQGSQVAIPVTAIVSGSVLTSWAVPVSSASPDTGSSIEGQTQPKQQPESNIAVIGGTTFSFLATSLANVGSEGTLPIEQSTQQPQPVAVTALVSGSIVTSYGVPLQSTSPGLGSAQTQSYQQPETDLAVIGGTTVSFLTASPSPSAGGRSQGPQPIAITALVSGSVVTSYAVALSSGTGDNLIANGQTQLSPPPEATFAVIGGTTVSFLTASSSPSAAGQSQGSQPEAVTAIVGGSIVTSWAVPVSSANSGDITDGQTQSLAQAELITTTIDGAVVTAWTVPAQTASPINDSPSNGQAQSLPSVQLITTTISGKAVTAWSIPSISGPAGNSPTQTLPQAELITTTISGHAVTAWIIPPSPSGHAQTPQLLQPSLITTTISGSVATVWSFPTAAGDASPSQPAAALISAIEGVVSQASELSSPGESPSSGSTRRLGTGASTATGNSGSNVLGSTTTQTGTSAIRPAAASSSTSGAGWVNVPWGGILAGCLVALVVV